MRPLAALLIALCLAAPARAQEPPEDGLGLVERGLRLLMQDLVQDMEPAMRDLGAMMDEFGPQMQALLLQMGPALEDLARRVHDIRHYERPEILPNGDIIIRRRPDAPRFTPPQGEITL